MFLVVFMFGEEIIYVGFVGMDVCFVEGWEVFFICVILGLFWFCCDGMNIWKREFEVLKVSGFVLVRVMVGILYEGIDRVIIFIRYRFLYWEGGIGIV